MFTNGAAVDAGHLLVGHVPRAVSTSTGVAIPTSRQSGSSVRPSVLGSPRSKSTASWVSLPPRDSAKGSVERLTAA
jgi:hypothetical protein